MHTTKERLVTAQWVLERQLTWIAAAEVKVGVIVTVNIAMLGGVAAAFGAAAPHSQWANVLAGIAIIALLGAIFSSAMAVLPRLPGPAKSLLFFGLVAKMELLD